MHIDGKVTGETTDKPLQSFHLGASNNLGHTWLCIPSLSTLAAIGIHKCLAVCSLSSRRL